jgi:sulfatase modifying factor 1
MARFLGRLSLSGACFGVVASVAACPLSLSQYSAEYCGDACDASADTTHPGHDGGHDARRDGDNDAGHLDGHTPDAGDGGLRDQQSGTVCGALPAVATSYADGGTGQGHDCGDASDCCATLCVPGGVFDRSNGLSGAAEAYVAPFYLDKYEVTVGRFTAFVKAGQGTTDAGPAVDAGAHPGIPASGWNSSWNSQLPPSTEALTNALQCGMFSSYGGDGLLPIGCVDWYLAFAFCIWDGGRLPTEAEWNFAAAGGALQRTYPWGDAAVSPYYAAYGCTETDAGLPCTSADLPHVGSRSPQGDSIYGHADLSGSMEEWVLDQYAPYLACHTEAGSQCANVMFQDPGGAGYDASIGRSERGEGWESSNFLTTYGRDRDKPTTLVVEKGVRCARDPQ